MFYISVDAIEVDENIVVEIFVPTILKNNYSRFRFSKKAPSTLKFSNDIPIFYREFEMIQS